MKWKMIRFTMLKILKFTKMNNYEVEILLEAGYTLNQLQQMTPQQRRNLAMECQAAEDEYYDNL